MSTDIKVGSVWEDTDPRQGGRTIEVLSFEKDRQGNDVAVVRLNTPSRNVSKSAIGRRTRIRLDRFPIDYKLSDVEPHRYGTSGVSHSLGYHPVSQLLNTESNGR